MRILSEAMTRQVRATLGRPQTEMPSRLPGRRRRHTLTVLSIVLGTALGVGYTRLMVHDSRWLVYLLAAVGGFCLVFLVVVIPRLVWAFLRKVWYRIALRQNADKAQALSTRAQRHLTEQDGEGLPAEQRTNDLAVVACLRRDYVGAARALQPLMTGNGAGPEAANLLVALVETRQWDDLDAFLTRPATQRDGLPEADLARAAFSVPAGPITARLEALAREGRYPRVLNNLGVRALRAGQEAWAEQSFALALQQRPNYALARANRGVLAYRRGDVTTALTDTASAGMLALGEAVICNNLGALLCQAGDRRLAERWLLRARNLEGRSAAIEVNLGNAYAVQGKYEDALDTYLAAGHLGESAEASHNMVLVRFVRQEYAEALEAAQQAQTRAPEDADVLNNLGCCLWQQSRYDEAEDYFARAVDLAPNSVARGNLISAALAAGRTDETLQSADESGDTSETRAFERGLAYLLTAMGIDPKAGVTQSKLYEYNLTSADTQFRKVISAGDGAVSEAWLNLGLVNYLSRDYEPAADAFVNAAKGLGESSGEMAYPTAICFLLAGVWTQEQHGISPDAGIVPAARELFRKARPYLEKAMETRSVAELAAYNLGVLHYLLGEHEKAIALLHKTAVSDAPSYVFNALAIAEARRAQEMQKEIAAASMMGDQRKRHLGGQVAKLLGSAIHYFREVLRVQPHSPIVHANIGLAFMLRNQGQDVETALHHWQLMRQVGGEWGQKAFDLFSRAMSSEEARKLQFQDIEMTFQQLPVADWVAFVPPRLTGLKYVMEDLPDLPDWQFAAYHPLVKRALRCRARAEALRAKLGHLAV